MDSLKRHHHFKQNEIPHDDRIATLERLVVEELMTTGVPDDKRDSSVVWELKHQAGIAQCARMLAAKRDLDPETAAAGALLHDVAVIVTGSYEDHARRGEGYARRFLGDSGDFTSKETENIIKVIVNHSDKHILSDDPWVEFGKDADILDCFLYPNSIDEYLLTKPFTRNAHYLRRAQKVWSELGLPSPRSFGSLNEFRERGWLVPVGTFAPDIAALIAAGSITRGIASPVAMWQEGSEIHVATTHSQVDLIREVVAEGQACNVSFLPEIADSMLMVWPTIGRYQRIPLDEGLAYVEISS